MNDLIGVDKNHIGGEISGLNPRGAKLGALSGSRDTIVNRQSSDCNEGVLYQSFRNSTLFFPQ